MTHVPLRFLSCLLVSVVAAGCSEAVTPTAATTTDTTAFTFSSSFTARGSASRSFEQLATGVVDLTLTAASPDVRLGIGIGIPRPDGSGCNLTHAVAVGAGGTPQLTVAAEAGVWCVRVYDVGFVPERVAFTLEVSHF